MLYSKYLMAIDIKNINKNTMKTNQSDRCIMNRMWVRSHGQMFIVERTLLWDVLISDQNQLTWVFGGQKVMIFYTSNL